MKKILMLLCAIFLYFGLYAQNIGLGVTEADIMQEVKMNQNTQNRMKKSKLNFFLDEDWQGGVVFTKDSLTINNYLLRYNIYTDQIEYRTVIRPNQVNIISIGSRKFVFTEFWTEDSIKNNGYFELLENGECKLLLRRSIKFSEGRDDIDAYGASASTNIREALFIKKGNEPAVMVEKSKDSIKEYLSDKKEVIKYIEEKFVLFVTKKTLQDIVNYYNNI